MTGTIIRRHVELLVGSHTTSFYLGTAVAGGVDTGHSLMTGVNGRVTACAAAQKECIVARRSIHATTVPLLQSLLLAVAFSSG